MGPCMDGSPLARGSLSVCSCWLVRPCIRPIGAAFHMPLAIMPFARLRSRSKARTRSARPQWVLLIRRYQPALCINSCLPFPTSSATRAPCLVLCDDRLPVAFAVRHQCPDHPGGLVGKRNRCNLGRSPRHQLHKPWPPGPVSLGIADDRHRPDHEHLAQIAIAGLEMLPSFSLPPLEFC